jgi:hypothetical protein
LGQYIGETPDVKTLRELLLKLSLYPGEMHPEKNPGNRIIGKKGVILKPFLPGRESHRQKKGDQRTGNGPEGI